MKENTINSNETELIQPWYRQFWPWFLFSLPASVVIAGTVTIVIAFKTPVSMVSTDYYKDGLAINENLRQFQLAKALQLQANLVFSSERIEIRLNNDRTESMELALAHPTTSQLDVNYSLIKNAPGHFIFNGDQTKISGRRYLKLTGYSLEGEWALRAEIDDASSFQITLSANDTLSDQLSD